MYVHAFGRLSFSNLPTLNALHVKEDKGVHNSSNTSC